MKKKYLSPDVQTVSFETENILDASVLLGGISNKPVGKDDTTEPLPLNIFG